MKIKLTAAIIGAVGVLLFSTGQGCTLVATVTAPSFDRNYTFNYYVGSPDESVYMAPSSAGGMGDHTLNHIVPRPRIVQDINIAMPLIRNSGVTNGSEVYKQIIAQAKLLANSILSSSGANQVARDLDGSTLGEGGVCSGSTNSLFSWLPGDLFLGPKSSDRSWDPGSRFDMWAKYFVSDATYNKMYIDMNTNLQMSPEQAKLFGIALKDKVLSRFAPYSETYKDQKISQKWMYKQINNKARGKKGFCPVGLVQNNECPSNGDISG